MVDDAGASGALQQPRAARDDGQMIRRAEALCRAAAFEALRATRAMLPQPRMSPDFVVIGAQKAGTSTLAARLFAHPQVLPPLRREVHYFDLHHTRSRAWYQSHFPTVRERDAVARVHGKAITGESSPYYLFHPSAPVRLHAVVPDVRLIAILREPVERAISEYHHAVRLEFETRPIDVALSPGRQMMDDLPERWSPWDDRDGWPRRRSYIERGHYAIQLERWFAVVPREQMLIISTDDLRNLRAHRLVQDFLGLEPFRQVHGIVRNVNHYDDPPIELRDRLAAHYAPHNARLRELLGFLPWSDGETADASAAITRAADPGAL